MRRQLLLLGIMCLLTPLFGQFIAECPGTGTIVLSSFCGDACVVCDINGYVGTNDTPALGEAPPGFCAGQLHNTQWVGFVAGSTNLTLSVSVYDCTIDQDGNGVNEGLQIGIYNTTDCSSYNLVSNCDQQVPEGTSQTFTTGTLTVGGIYFLVIDGAFGDVCSFQVNVISGSTTAPDVSQVMPNIVAPSQVCQGGNMNISVTPAIFGAGAYLWTLDGDEVATDRESMITAPSEPGTYTLCVTPYNPCSQGVRRCVTFQVVPPVPMPMAVPLCEGRTFSFAGETYTDPGVFTVTTQGANGCDEIIELNIDLIPTVETFLAPEICYYTSYFVGGQEFTDAGQYDITLPAAGTGCDSIVHLDLSFIGSFETTNLNETICEGETYTVGTNVLNATGDYFFTLQGESGCDSLVDISLRVLPRPRSTINATICTGQSYAFNGTNYTTSGTYTRTFPRPAGCDSVAVLNLTVSPNVTTNLTRTVCAGESFTIGNTAFSTTGMHSVTLPSANDCDSIVRLNLTVRPEIITTATASICQGETYTNGSSSFTTAGTYNIPYTASNGCDSTYRVTLSVLPNSTQTLNPAICAGQTYTFAGQNFTTAGTYTVLGTAANGCVSTTTINLSVSSVISTIQNVALCPGESVTIGGSTLTDAGTYNFTFASVGGCDSLVTVNVTENTVTTTNLTETICQGTTYTLAGQTYNMTGSYMATLQDANGCDSIVALALTVTPPPSTLSTASICEGQSFTFNGTAYTASGLYTANLVTAGGCDSIAQLNLTVTQTITNTIAPVICTGTSFSIGGDVLTAAGTYTYSFPSAAGCDSVVTVNLTVEDALINNITTSICEGETYTVGTSNYTLPGNYTDSFVTPEGCDSLVRLALTVIPTVSTNLNERICAGESYLMGGTAYTATGTYTATLPTVASGCDSIVTLTLRVVDIPVTTIDASICDSGSYTLGGNAYTTAGQYTAVFASADGCDSTVVLNLEVTTFYETNLNIRLCEGESYTVGSNTYTTAGMYQNMFTSQDGCDSIVNLNLTINALPNVQIDAAICEGESYTIGGMPFSTTGMHQVVVPSVLTGCDSTIVLNLTVNPVVNTSLVESICAGESFTVGTTDYTMSGNYTQTLMTSSGCDSVVILQLTVVPLPETFLTEVICDGESVTVGSQTFGTTGQYTVVLPSVTSGCDSTIYLDLTVNPLPNTPLTEAICQGESYTIGGTSFSTTGMHQVTVPSVVTGCDSTIVLNLTVNPTYNLSQSATLCEGESITIGSSTYNTTGVWTTLLTTAEGCDSTVVLTLTVNDVLTTTLTEILCAGESTTVGTTTYNQSGTYTQTLAAASGCDSIVTLNLTVLPLLSTTLPASICEGESYTVGTETFTTAGSYTVLLASTATGCDSTVFLNLSVNPIFNTTLTETICTTESFEMGGQSYTTTGIFTANLATAAGCDSTVVLNLTVIPCALLFESSIVDNACFGASAGSITFSMTVGSAPYSYTWAAVAGSPNGTGNIATNGQPTTLPNLPAGRYSISATDANGVARTWEETVSEPAPIALTLTPDTYNGFNLTCADATDGRISATAIGGTLPYTYNWGSGDSTAVIDALPAGAYALTLTDVQGCTQTATTTLVAPAPVTATVVAQSPICYTETTGILRVEATTGGSGPYLYALDGSAYAGSSTFPNVALGTHTVTVQDANGCTTATTLDVLPAPVLTVDLGQDTSLVYGTSIRLHAETSYPVVQYSWSEGPILECDTCANPLISPSDAISYAVEVTDASGCTARDRITVLVNKPRGVFIPNAFSPNGDASNDVFLVFGGSEVVVVRTFYVFNRWGESVFEGSNLNPNDPTYGWDGKHRGIAVNTGVYVYVAEVEFTDGEVIVYKGEVVLMP